ncbi:MAG: FAD-dependent oxidoreductase [Phycisphaerales bacterium JB047]
MSMPEDSTKRPVIIIGAGLSGLVCARHLTESGVECLVLDRGRVPGGRVATKTLSIDNHHFCFNHGASKLDCLEPETRVLLTRLGIENLSHTGALTAVEMQSIPERLARTVQIHRSTHVERIRRDPMGWEVTAKQFGISEPITLEASHIIFTCPTVQAARVLDSSGVESPDFFRLVGYESQWVLLLTLGGNNRSLIPTVRLPHPYIDSIEVQTKHDCDLLIARMKPEESAARYDESPEEIERAMIQAVLNSSDDDAAEQDSKHSILGSCVHRWGLARVRDHVHLPCFVNHDLGLGYAGDYFAGEHGSWRDADAAILSAIRCSNEIWA